MSHPGAAAAVPMPLAHTVDSTPAPSTPTPVRSCTPTGRGRPRRWTTTQVTRLSQLWFEALAGICAHVRRGGGGLTPSDIAPARLSQHQIDELQQQYRIADVLPLTPLQQGCSSTPAPRGTRRRRVRGAARLHHDRPARPGPAARCGAHRRHPASQPGGPLLPTVRRAGADHPGDPVAGWQYVELGRRQSISTSRSSGVRRRTRRGLRPRRPAGLPGGTDPHRRATGTGLC